MKHLLTAIACFFALSMSAQTPYNPDSDGDNLIGINDVLDFLPYFGNEFYPEIIQPVFQTCVTQPADTCFVNEGTDIVFVQFNVSDGRLALPNDTTFKKLIVISDSSGPQYVDVIGKGSPSDEWNQLYQGFDSNDAATFYRTPSGFWRLIQDQY